MAEELKETFESFGENTEIHITFTLTNTKTSYEW